MGAATASTPQEREREATSAAGAAATELLQLETMPSPTRLQAELDLRSLFGALHAVYRRQRVRRRQGRLEIHSVAAGLSAATARRCAAAPGLAPPGSRSGGDAAAAGCGRRCAAAGAGGRGTDVPWACSIWRRVPILNFSQQRLLCHGRSRRWRGCRWCGSAAGGNACPACVQQRYSPLPDPACVPTVDRTIAPPCKRHQRTSSQKALGVQEVHDGAQAVYELQPWLRRVLHRARPLRAVRLPCRSQNGMKRFLPQPRSKAPTVGSRQGARTRQQLAMARNTQLCTAPGGRSGAPASARLRGGASSCFCSLCSLNSFSQTPCV